MTAYSVSLFFTIYDIGLLNASLLSHYFMSCLVFALHRGDMYTSSWYEQFFLSLFSERPISLSSDFAEAYFTFRLDDREILYLLHALTPSVSSLTALLTGSTTPQTSTKPSQRALCLKPRRAMEVCCTHLFGITFLISLLSGFVNASCPKQKAPICDV